MTTFDPKVFKQSTHAQWNAVAVRWNGWGPLLDHWLGPPTERLLDMMQLGEGDRVHHVAGGSGQEALQSARRVGPQGYVLTTDISEDLTDLATANFTAAGLDHAEARVSDGEDLALDDALFDAVLSRVGLIFFPDQPGSLRQQMRALKPNGRVGAIVYATGEECRFFFDPVTIIRRRAALPPPLPGQPGPFSLGAPGVIEALFEKVGLVDVATEKVSAPVILESAAECLRFEQESFGALHQMLGKLSEDDKAAAWQEVGEALARFESERRFEGPCTMILAVGRKP